MGFRVSRPLAVLGLTGLCLFANASTAEAGVPPPIVVPGEIVVAEGDTPDDGAAVVSVQRPWVNDEDQVGFIGFLDNGDHFVWVDDAVIWRGSDDVDITLTGPQDYMDSNGAGDWVYEPNAAGQPSLYTNNGLFATVGDAAPGITDGFYTNPSGPQLTADGTLYWVGLVDTGGGPEPDIEALFRTTDGTNAGGEVVLSTGDVLEDPLTIANFVNYAYQASEENDHLIINLELATDPVSNQRIWVDDAVVLTENDTAPDDELWDFFYIVAINNDGNYVVTADTDGNAATNHVMIYNGEVVLREGDTVDGIDIVDVGGFGGPDNATIRFVALNNVNQIAYDFAYDSPGGFRESVFFACNADDVPGSSVEVFSSGSHGLDVDDDEVSDFFIEDVYDFQPHDAINVGDDGNIYVTVTLNDGKNPPFDAVIRVTANCCGNGSVDGDEECDDGNEEDGDACLSDCTANTCGDGIVNADDEECDDEGESEACDEDCTLSECGDGTVNMVAGEECDDGNTDDGDGCSAQCLEDTDVSGSGDSGDTTDGMMTTTGVPPTTMTSPVTTVTRLGKRQRQRQRHRRRRERRRRRQQRL